MGSRQVEIDFKFRPSEPLPRPDFGAATTTDLADIALYANNKVFFGAYSPLQAPFQAKESKFLISEVPESLFGILTCDPVTLSVPVDPAVPKQKHRKSI